MAAKVGRRTLRQRRRTVEATYEEPEEKAPSSDQAAPKKDIVCLDETRVRLTLNVPPATDYIHANWIKFEGHDKEYIATQAPLDNTIEDFWRMVFQVGSPHIVNLTKIRNLYSGGSAGRLFKFKYSEGINGFRNQYSFSDQIRINAWGLNKAVDKIW
ncbi:unnamed protein product [Haemonchus placei]|uniref:Tyrosine-protein phosphatase domain-containing protein n=1 Tax=Haemonchus placei TaxID=6290 RepID=A0A0N4WX28_HAEPC|nr:unnamed protein product [Haemonchus placei]